MVISYFIVGQFNRWSPLHSQYSRISLYSRNEKELNLKENFINHNEVRHNHCV